MILKIRLRSIGLFLCVFSALVAGSAAYAKVSVFIFDSGFKPYDQNSRHNRQQVKKLYSSADRDDVIRKFILAAGVHGQIVGAELSRGIKRNEVDFVAFETDDSLGKVRGMLERLGRADILGTLSTTNPHPLTKPDAVSPKPLVDYSSEQLKVFSDSQLRDYYQVHFENSFVKPLLRLKAPPDFVNLSMRLGSNGKSVADRQKHKALIAEQVQNWVTRYPKTLFVVSAGNEGVDANDAAQYSWTGVLAQNLVVVGSTDQTGKSRAWFSNYGSHVDVYVDGTNVGISSGMLFGPFHFPQYFKTEGTSFSAPRFTNRLIRRLVDLRKRNPLATSWDAYVGEIRTIARQ